MASRGACTAAARHAPSRARGARAPLLMRVRGAPRRAATLAEAAPAPAQTPQLKNGTVTAGEEGKPYAGGSSVAVHGGEHKCRPRVSDAMATPIVQTATYTFVNTDELIAYQEGTFGSYEYGRYGNPTSRACELKMAELERGEDALLSSSGMNTATTMLLALVPAGGHIVTTTDCYRRTRQFIQTMLPKMGITATVLDPADLEGLEKALKENDVSLYFSESPTNPYLRCIDVAKVSEMCHTIGSGKTVVAIDGTFATPHNMRPLDFGADLVVQSATKFLAGHNDVLGGALIGKMEYVSEVRKLHNVLGGTVDPHAAYLILRGMKTLALRVDRANANALKLAKFLEAHPKIAKVHYPGLPSHPEHEIAKMQMTSGFGGVVSFEVDGDRKTTSDFIDACKIPYIAPSLGGVESLIEQPAVISYWDYTSEERKQFGINDNLVRFSCGIEEYEDLELDFAQALAQI